MYMRLRVSFWVCFFIVVLSFLVVLQMNSFKSVEDINYMPPDPDVYVLEEEKGVDKGQNEVRQVEPQIYRVSRFQEVSYDSGGTEKVLMIPIAFLDVDFQKENDLARFNQMGERLKDYYEVNSDYKEGVSGVSLDCYVSEVVYSEYDMAEYGEDDPTGEADSLNGSISRLAAEAVEKLYDTGFDFSEFDRDGDLVIDHVIIIHAGKGQEQALDDALIWSHHYYVSEAVELGGMDIDSYMMVPESGELGVFAHEFGHEFGLPDLYDVDGMEGGYSNGIGRWGIMGTGSWNHLSNEPAGSTPSNLCAWSRDYLGWADTEVIVSDSMNVKVDNSNGISELVKIYPMEAVGNEYFLVEYRRPIGYDEALPGEGGLVWHIDKDMIDVNIGTNSVNSDETRLGVELEEADGEWNMWFLHNHGDDSDPFNGKENNHHFTFLPYGLNLSNGSKDLTYVDIMDFDILGNACVFNVFVDKKAARVKSEIVSPTQGEIVDGNPVFEWYPVPHVLLYVLEISSDPEFIDGSIVESVVVSSDSGNLIYDGEYVSFRADEWNLASNNNYYVRVAGVGAEEEELVYSDRVRFVVDYFDNESVVNVHTHQILQDPENDNVFYMTDRENRVVIRYNYQTGEKDIIPYLGMPEHMYIDDHRLYVTIANGEHGDNIPGAYSMIDLYNFKKIDEISLTMDPFDIVVTKNDYVVISNGFEGNTTEGIRSYIQGTGDIIGEETIEGQTFIYYSEYLDNVYGVVRFWLKVLDMESDGEINWKYSKIHYGAPNFREECLVSSDGQYIFNAVGRIYRVDGMELVQVIEPYYGIALDDVNKRFYTVGKKYICGYEYPSMKIVERFLLKGEYNELFIVDGQLIGVNYESESGKTFFDEIILDEIPTPISFSLNGENAGKLMGTLPGMKYSIGTFSSGAKLVTEADVQLNQSELISLASSKVIYLYLDGYSEIDADNWYSIELEERAVLLDEEFFSNIVWSEETNQLIGLDERFEYRYSGMTEWESYPAEGIKGIFDGRVYVRFGADGLTLPGEAFAIELVGDEASGNEFGWLQDVADVEWIDDHIGYILSEDGDLVQVNMESNMAEFIDLEYLFDDLYYMNGKLVGVALSDGAETVLYLINLDSGNYECNELARTGGTLSIIGSSSGHLCMQESVSKQLFFYNWESNIIDVFDVLEDAVVEDMFLMEDGTIITVSGKILVINELTGKYKVSGQVDGGIISAQFNPYKNVYMIFGNDGVLKVYDMAFALVGEYGFDTDMVDWKICEEGYIHTFKDSVCYRIGNVYDYIEPNVTFSLDGTEAMKIMGSTSLMEVDFGHGYMRIPYGDFVVDASELDVDGDIRIRYKRFDRALETGETYFDIKEGEELPALTVNDTTNRLSGLTGDMEYSRDGGVRWMLASGSTVFDGDVTVVVRNRAKGLTLAGPSKSFEFTKNPSGNTGGNIGGNVGGSPSGGTGGVPSGLVIADEATPEFSFTNEEGLRLGFNNDELGDFIDLKLYDSGNVSIVAMSTVQGEDNLGLNYLELVDESAYQFKVIGMIGKTEVAVGQLMSDTTIVFETELKEYTSGELKRIGVFKLEDGQWKYAGGAIDSDGHMMLKTDETGTYALMMGTRTFKDITNHWAKDYVEIMAAKQITNGKGYDLFDPDSNITRAEYVAVIARSLKLKEGKNEVNVYKDVAEGKWYDDVLHTAKSNGLISSGLNFDPDVDIVREDMMVIAAEALKQTMEIEDLSTEEVDEILGSFSDGDLIQGNNRKAVAITVKYGIITGRKVDYLAIDQTASRAETMVVMMRLMEVLGL